MKTILFLTATFFGIAYSGWSQSYPGNLAVLRVGNGATPLVATGNPIFLDQYSPAGALVNSVSIPDSGPTALLISGSASSEGFISRSANGRLITFAGYNTNLSNTNSISSSASTLIPRGIGTVDYLGHYNFVTNTSVYFSANNVRSAATDGTNNFWGAGAASGTVYLGLVSPPAVVQSVNTEVVGIFNGNLYFSSQKTPSIGIYAFAGTPVTTASANLLIASSGPSSPSPYGFAISPDTAIVYVADDNTIAKKGGIQKYVNTVGTWSLAYTLGTGANSTTGARALAVDFSGASPVIYATTADSVSNHLISVTDTGAGSVPAVLATAGTNELFRGVQFAAQGGPLAATLSSVSLSGGQLSFEVTGTPGYSYVVQTSSDLVNWSPLATNTAPFTLSSGPLNSTAQFYRAVASP